MEIGEFCVDDTFTDGPGFFESGVLPLEIFAFGVLVVGVIGNVDRESRLGYGTLLSALGTLSVH